MSEIEIIEGLLKGEICNRNGCDGIIDEHATETSCSCHVNPPCSHCTTDRNYCPKCDWEGPERDTPVIDKDQSERNRVYYEKQNKEWQEARDLFYARYSGQKSVEKLEMRHEAHTHFSQKIVGVFPIGTETRESILPKVNGTFGGRFERWGDYFFSFIAYTD